VDAFLDRVEATLAGRPLGEPAVAEDVQDIVFRVRFGGYDEWEVDVHLDRVQRQLAGLEVGPSGDFRREDAVRPDVVRPDVVRPDVVRPDAAFSDATFLDPTRADVRGAARPERVGPVVAGPGRPEPARGRVDTSGELRTRRGAPAESYAANGSIDGPPGGETTFLPTTGDRRPTPPGFGGPAGPPPPGRPEPPAYTYQARRTVPEPEGYVPGRPGRHGRPDMTAEVHTMAPGSPFTRNDIERLAELRTTFTPRRFGSGYDAGQVEQLFEAISATLHGRSGGALDPADLDPAQFTLVSGGYFEAEVDQALREVREIVGRRLR
jgi:DivIVA domain-containing protein